MEPKRRGPPPRYASRKSYSTRIKHSTHEKLVAACRESGRSISEEIEFRLEQSVVAGDLEAVWGAMVTRYTSYFVSLNDRLAFVKATV